MSRLLAIISVMCGMWLAGCAHEQAQGLRGFVWQYQSTPEEGAKLAYGIPGSDDVALMMTCRPGSGAVTVSTAGSPVQPLVLASRGTASSLKGVAVEGLPGGPMLVSARADAGDGALARFARTGDLRLTSGGHTAAIDAQGADRTEVRRFFAACA